MQFLGKLTDNYNCKRYAIYHPFINQIKKKMFFIVKIVLFITYFLLFPEIFPLLLLAVNCLNTYTQTVLKNLKIFTV